MNRDYFTQPLQSDRLADSYGNTHLGSDIRADLSWLKGGMIAGLAVGLSLTVAHFWPQIVAGFWAVVS